MKRKLSILLILLFVILLLPLDILAIEMNQQEGQHSEEHIEEHNLQEDESDTDFETDDNTEQHGEEENLGEEQNSDDSDEQFNEQFDVFSIQALNSTVHDWSSFLGAIAAAADGETITISADIVLESTVMIDKSLNFQAESPVTISVQGAFRHFLIPSGSDIQLSFNQVTLDGGSSGGGVESLAGALTLENIVIQNCKGFQTSVNPNVRPGAIFIHNDSALTIKGDSCILDNNSNVLGYGGGIYGGARSSILLEGSTVVKRNQATYGAGIYLDIAASIIVGEDVQIIENVSNDRGGGIRMEKEAEATIYGSVSNNEDRYAAGGISANAEGCVVTIDGGKVNHNKNGAISALYGYLGTYPEITVIIKNGGEVCHNTSSGRPIIQARNLYIYDGKINDNTNYKLTPSTISAIDFYFYDGEIMNNRAIESQGSQFADYVTGTTVFCRESFYMEDGLIANNQWLDPPANVKGCYGTVYVYGVQAEIKGGTFRDNLAVYDTDNLRVYGGALAMRAIVSNSEQAKDMMLIIENATFEGNQSNHGGAISCDSVKTSSANILVKDCIFEDNAALSYGGAVYVNGCIAKVQNSTFQNNEGSYGGAIGNYYGAIEISEQTQFIHNKGDLGGAVYSVNAVGKGTLLKDSYFKDNQSDSFGGAVYNNRGTVEIENSTFEHNQSETGGAVFNYLGNASVFGNTLFQGNAADYGGAIYCWPGNGGGSYLTVDGQSSIVQFLENTAINGGALFINKDFLQDVSINNALFSQNLADKGMRWNLDDPATWPQEIASVLEQAAAVYGTNISNVSPSGPFTNVYNNFDVSFPYQENIEGTTVTLHYYKESLQGEYLGTKTLNTYIGAPLPVLVSEYLNQYLPEGHANGSVESLGDFVTNDLELAVIYRQIYTITYDPNPPAGSYQGSTVDSSIYFTGSKVIVLNNGFVCPGYTFQHWNTEADGSGTSRPAGGELTMPDHDVTLYAIWQKNKTTSPPSGGSSGNGAGSEGSTNNLDKEEKEVQPAKKLDLLNRSEHYAYLFGYLDGTIRPNDGISRAETASIFFNLLTEEARNEYYSEENTFNDVGSGDWFNEEISTITNAGIMSGYPDGRFQPNFPITRGEFAAVVKGFADDQIIELTDFLDTEGHWAEQSIETVSGSGWITGYPDGSFRPDADITRAEVVSIVNHMLDRLPDEEDDLIKDMIKWPDNPVGTWYYLEVQEASNGHFYKIDEDHNENWIGLRENNGVSIR